jgi:DNA invertase Pin-like site-specific DNA recombinase
MLVLGYVRVSTIDQEKGYGKDVQEGAVREYAKAHNFPDIEIIEESASGESLVKRKELRQIIVRAKAARAEGDEVHVIFYKLDRLSRLLTDQEAVVMQALEYGYRLHSTYSAEDDCLDPAYAGDPMRTAIRQVLGAFSQLDRATVQGRMDSGLHEKAKTGGSTGGRTPFGYLSSNQELIINELQRPAVVRLFQLKERGIDLAGTASVLAREFPKECGHWTKTHTMRALRRRDLYQHGIYRSRVGVDAVKRPELIILPTDFSNVKAPPKREGPIDWDTVADPVSINTLALLLRETPAAIQRRVTDNGIQVSWLKGRMMIPHASAQTIERLHVADSAVTTAGT